MSSVWIGNVTSIRYSQKGASKQQYQLVGLHTTPQSESESEVIKWFFVYYKYIQINPPPPPLIAAAVHPKRRARGN